MVLHTHPISHKSIKLRAGEATSVILAEPVSLSQLWLRFDMECTLPKTLNIYAKDSREKFVPHNFHIRIDKMRSEMEMSAGDAADRKIDELHFSVPEDTEFHVAAYLKDT